MADLEHAESSGANPRIDSLHEGPTGEADYAHLVAALTLNIMRAYPPTTVCIRN